MTGQFAQTAAKQPRDIPEWAEKSAGIRTLIVDDEPLVRWAVAETLAERGHEISEAGDAASARRAILVEPPDLVLLDLRLPDCDNLDLAFFIRACTPESRVVLMTAFGTNDILAEALALGVPVLAKPFDLSELASIVDRTLSSPHW
jgi:DNA-binding NtrC family response regulator